MPEKATELKSFFTLWKLDNGRRDTESSKPKYSIVIWGSCCECVYNNMIIKWQENN